MRTVLITGSAGLIGSEASRFFAAMGWRVVGIDNDMRRKFFGESGSTLATAQALSRLSSYEHFTTDIRDAESVGSLFQVYRPDVVIHTAAQPSHDWAANDPQTDFGVNATGTLNLLDAARRYAKDSPFVFTSTNKVYGDTPNRLTLTESATRLECPALPNGIDETMGIDQTTHSLFGASKVAADVLVQEYGRYFDMPTVCFRGGCLTGPAHAGVKQHGFLSYLVRCATTGTPYTIIGHSGKQVRDNIHSADLVAAFWEFVQNPRCGAVYNIGGGLERSCSVIEAVDMVEQLTGRRTQTGYEARERIGDHRWWITDCGKFMADYPGWRQTRTLTETVAEMVAAQRQAA